MTPRIESLFESLRAIELEIESELAVQNAKLRFGLQHGRAEFDAEVLRRHREMQVRVLTYLREARPLVMLTAPVIYALGLPLLLLDLFAIAYQAICFPVYGIAKVRRSDYFVFDRQYLAYLNAIEKFNCAYCSYANGVVGFVREIGSRTEEYWCPIKHARRIVGAHARYSKFENYGDGDAYQRELEKHRADLGRDEPPAA